MRPIFCEHSALENIGKKTKKKALPDLHIFMQMWCVIEGLS